MPSDSKEDRLIDFGDVPDAVNDILQRGVALFRHDPPAAAACFRTALAADPSVLATYFCLYKIHTYTGRFDDALAMARAGAAEAARVAGLSADWRAWTYEAMAASPDAAAARFALYTLKALAFIHLKRGETADSQACLVKLAELEAAGDVGSSVVAELRRAVA